MFEESWEQVLVLENPEPGSVCAVRSSDQRTALRFFSHAPPLPPLLISSNSFQWLYLCFQLSHTFVLFLLTDPVPPFCHLGPGSDGRTAGNQFRWFKLNQTLEELQSLVFAQSCRLNPTLISSQNIRNQMCGLIWTRGSR